MAEISATDLQVEGAGTELGEVSLKFSGAILGAQNLLPPISPAHSHKHAFEGVESVTALHVCQECQDTLIHAFEHCLSKSKIGVTSISAVEEVIDGIPLTDPPYFNVIKDPTQDRNILYIDPSEKLQTERIVFMRNMRNKLSESISPGKIGSGKLATKGLFAGSLYKSVLQAKDKEIDLLRSMLYEKTVSEKFEHENVEKLRGALQRSVKYYTKAEEWQDLESQRLQRDVRYLKADFSSLMAYLVNSEEEKRAIFLQVETAQRVVRERDTKVLDLGKVISDLKAKLHTTFKEFLQMNEVIAHLRVEADRGTETMMHRNDILQRNLDKISKDFDFATSELQDAKNRISELEFELSELILQFNNLGDAKKKEKESSVKLSSELTTTNRILNELQLNHADIVSRHLKLENFHRDTVKSNEDSIKTLKAQVDELTTRLEQTHTAKVEYESASKTLKADCDRGKSALSTVTRQKDEMESRLITSERRSMDLLEEKDLQLKDFQDELIEVRIKSKKFSESREQLLFQTTELRNALDREQSNTQMLTFDIQQLKKTSKEKETALSAEIDKLNAIKSGLAIDKRQLQDQGRELMLDLERREEELKGANHCYEKFEEKRAETIHILNNKLNCMDVNLAALRAEHFTLTSNHSQLITQHHEIFGQRAFFETACNELTELNNSYIKDIAGLKEAKESLRREVALLDQQKLNQSLLLGSLDVKVIELGEIILRDKAEASEIIRDKDGKITKFGNEVSKLRDDTKLMHSNYGKLKNTYKAVLEALKVARKRLLMESLSREEMELNVNALNLNLKSERKSRAEFERLHDVLKRRMTDQDAKTGSSVRLRERKLLEVNQLLASEYSRLTEVGHMMTQLSTLVK